MKIFHFLSTQPIIETIISIKIYCNFILVLFFIFVKYLFVNVLVYRKNDVR